MPALELYLVPPQDAPDLRLANILERLRKQSAVPLPVAFRWRLLEQVQHAPLGAFIVSKRFTASLEIRQSEQPLPGKPLPPFRDASRPRAQAPGDRVHGKSFVCKQNNARPLRRFRIGGSFAGPIQPHAFLFFRSPA